MPGLPPPPILALSPLDRDALALLATSPRGASRLDWDGWVRAAGLRLGPTQASAFQATVSRLEEAGAVAPSFGGRSLDVPDHLVPWVLEDAHARGRISALVRPLLQGRLAWSASDQLARIALALRDAPRVAEAIERARWMTSSGDTPALVSALTCAAPSAWLDQLSAEHLASYLGEALLHAIVRLIAPGADVLAAAAGSDHAPARALCALARALSGDADAARATLVVDPSTPWERGALAVVALTEGRWADAIAGFDRASMTKQGKRRASGLPSLPGLFDVLLAASPAGRAGDAAGLGARVDGAAKELGGRRSAVLALEALASFRSTGRNVTVPAAHGHEGWVDHLVCGLAARWVPPHGLQPCPPRLVQAARAAGFAWLGDQLQALDDRSAGEGKLAALKSDRAPWELALEALSSAIVAQPSERPAGDAGEIVWVIEHATAELDAVRITARHVKKRGTQGAQISSHRLAHDASLPMTDADRRLAIALSSRPHVYLEPTLRALLSVVGHPRVRDASGAPLVVERGRPEIRVSSSSGGARLEVVPSVYAKSGVAIAREPGRLLVFEQTEAGARAAAILGTQGLEVPPGGLGKVATAIATMAPHVTVRGADALGEAVGARTEPADPRVHAQLFRKGSAFRARLRVVPGGTEGPALRPGSEPARVLVTGEGGARNLTRNLAEEKARLARLLDACPLLAALPGDGDDLVASDLETCLELLLELEGARGDDLVVEWPEGEPLRPPIARDVSALRVRVRASETQWLALQAELPVDEARVLALGDLVARMSTARGRFVPLGDGDYLALTERLREQVEALARVAALSDERGRTSLAMLPAITQWAQGAELELAKALEARLARLEAALATTPRVPRALGAELRDYQREGYLFLARRASCGLGSCLADDMGLGKTVQALALLLARARQGPALVVAPTSVCRNWEDEARRFAPTLTMRRLASAADRGASLAALEGGDVLLVSYGLLGSCAEALATRRFATAVFDEAHALKNPETRRAAAARSIVADAIVGLTGTPLENHLGELHSLFEVLAPGLLGTRTRFARAVSGPIAGGDRRATAQLRALVRPFLLRRTKAQVLDELPEKTEMTRVITPGDDERAFYEALRRRAVERVERASGPQARIQVLAEITKLRRAAIDPRLVGGPEAPPGAKLEALAELVAELREEGHRALVFSQFLEVLDRASEHLTAQGSRCVRLDGTMSPAERAASVDAFQSGQADVFLLSLRAGGLGMNLTAADYVIHVDPWWNPAVEDQATDRAHRIGQTRPVTVVRLVTEGTIEERVLKLHAGKRALYADALSDLDAAKALDVKALVDLLRAETPPAEGGF